MHSSRHVERGAAAVEFALVAMLLVAMIMGIIEFGRAWAVQGSLAQASREAAREMAVSGDASAARDHFYETFSPFGDTPTQAATATLAISRVGAPGDATCRDIVSSSYTTPTLTGFFGATFTVTGKGTMRCGG